MSLTEEDRQAILATPVNPVTGAPRRSAPTAYRVLAADAPRQMWLARRRQGIGSSDVPAILGVDPYGRGPRHVYWDKVGEGLAEEEADEAALWGRILEDPVAREWARRNRTTTQRVGIVANEHQGWMICTLDRRVGECPTEVHRSGGRCALEVKTRSAWLAGRWRQGIPDDVHAQLVWQMLVTGYDHMHLAVLIGGQDYRQYTIAADGELAAMVLRPVSGFWHGRVVPRAVPPPDARPDREIELEERLYPDRQDAIPITADALSALVAYRRLGDQITSLKVARDVAKKVMITELAGHQAATLDGETAYVYGQVNRRSVDLDRLAEMWPDAYRDTVADKTGHALQVKSVFQTEEE